jgi:hypothetical protein
MKGVLSRKGKLMSGGMLGVLGGLIGGLIGAYASIKNTSGPRERAFMIQVAVVFWIAITAFIFGLLALPRPFNFLLWVPYLISLPLAILWCNRRQRHSRAEEAAMSTNHPQFGDGSRG